MLKMVECKNVKEIEVQQIGFSEGMATLCVAYCYRWKKSSIEKKVQSYSLTFKKYFQFKKKLNNSLKY